MTKKLQKRKSTARLMLVGTTTKGIEILVIRNAANTQNTVEIYDIKKDAVVATGKYGNIATDQNGHDVPLAFRKLNYMRGLQFAVSSARRDFPIIGNYGEVHWEIQKQNLTLEQHVIYEHDKFIEEAVKTLV